MLRDEGAAKLRTITKTRHVPHFLIEVMSPSDRPSKQQRKCEEWIAAGVKEAFLLDPAIRTAYVYRANAPVENIPNAAQIESAALPGFALDCPLIWEEL